MLELALIGNRYYWAWLTFLLSMIAVGSAAYRRPGDAHKSSPIDGLPHEN